MKSVKIPSYFGTCIAPLPFLVLISAALVLLSSCNSSNIDDSASITHESIQARRHLLELFEAFVGDDSKKMLLDSTDRGCGSQRKLPESFWKTSSAAFFASGETQYYVPKGSKSFKIPEDSYLFAELKQELPGDLYSCFDGFEIVGLKNFAALLDSLPPESTRALILRGGSIGQKELQSLEKLRRLEYLQLFEVKFDSLLSAKNASFFSFPTLIHLKARYINEPALSFLLNCNRQLKVLDLKDADLSAGIIDAVSNLKNLEKLSLNSTDLDDRMLRLLLAGKSLRELAVHETLITDRSLIACIACQQNLTSLNLSRCKISDAGLAAIAACSRLESLDIAHTEIGDSGMAKLSRLKNLSVLNLAGSNCSIKVLKTLKQFKGLKDLNLEGMQLSVKDLQELQHSLPACRLRSS